MIRIGQNNQQKEEMKMRGYRSFRDGNKPLNRLATKLTALKEHKALQIRLFIIKLPIPSTNNTYTPRGQNLERNIGRKRCVLWEVILIRVSHTTLPCQVALVDKTQRMPNIYIHFFFNFYLF